MFNRFNRANHCVIYGVCPNTEFFLIRIFLHLNWIWRFIPKISVFSPNTGKYGTEKTPYLENPLLVQTQISWTCRCVSLVYNMIMDTTASFLWEVLVSRRIKASILRFYSYLSATHNICFTSTVVSFWTYINSFVTKTVVI